MSFKRFLALLLVLTLLTGCMSGCSLAAYTLHKLEETFSDAPDTPSDTPADPKPAPNPQTQPEPSQPITDASRLEPGAWDDGSLQSALKTANRLLPNSSGWEQLQPAYEAVMEAYDAYCDVCTLRSLACDLDPTDNDAREAYDDIWDQDPYDDVAYLVSAILASPLAEDYLAYTGNQRLLDLEGYTSSDDGTDALLDQEQDLVAEFEDLYYTMDDLEIAYQGGTWTWNTFLEEGYSLEDDDYNAIGLALEQNENEKLGGVIVQLVNLRNRIARSYGFHNYYELAWEAYYYRDYTIEEYLLLREAMGTYMPQAEALLERRAYDEESYYYGKDGYDWDMSGFFAFAAADERLPQELRDAFAVFDQEGLLTIPTDKGFDSGYMSMLFTRDLPIIYLYPYHSMYDLISVSHEAGHALNGYLCDEPAFEWNYFGSIDVSEVQSSATTLMLMDTLAAWQPELAEEIRLEALKYSVESMTQSVLDDDIERALYGYEGELTLEKANELTTQAYRAAGNDPSDYFSGRYLLWVESDHLAAYPAYTISYVVSAAAALAVWCEAQTDPDAAWEDYIAILHMPTTETDFQELVSACGLDAIFSAGFYQKLLGFVKAYSQ